MKFSPSEKQIPLDGGSGLPWWKTVLCRNLGGLQVRHLCCPLHVHRPGVDPGETNQRVEGLE